MDEKEKDKALQWLGELENESSEGKSLKSLK